MVQTPTRFPKGLTNRTVGMKRKLPVLDPTKYLVFFDDFVTGLNPGIANWVVTTLEAGAGSATEADAGEAGGAITLTNAAGDNDYDYLQAAAAFTFTDGYPVWFEARWKTADVSETEIFVGLMESGTSDGYAPDDAVHFRAGGPATALRVAKNGTATLEAGVFTGADATYVTAGFFWDGTGDSVEVWADGVQVATVDAGDNVPDDVVLSPTIGLRNDGAVAQNMTIDYVLAVQKRV